MPPVVGGVVAGSSMESSIGADGDASASESMTGPVVHPLYVGLPAVEPVRV
jgi:hypothetical protein